MNLEDTQRFGFDAAAAAAAAYIIINIKCISSSFSAFDDGGR